MNELPTERLLSRLEGVRRTGADQWAARCPSHQDKSPSLSIRAGDDGRILLHCFAGCSALDVMQAVGLTLADLFPIRLKPQTPQERRQAREAFKRGAWLAALNVVASETELVLIFARSLRIPAVDARLRLSAARLESALGVFNGR